MRSDPALEVESRKDTQEIRTGSATASAQSRLHFLVAVVPILT